MPRALKERGRRLSFSIAQRHQDAVIVFEGKWPAIVPPLIDEVLQISHAGHFVADRAEFVRNIDEQPDFDVILPQLRQVIENSGHVDHLIVALARVDDDVSEVKPGEDLWRLGRPR